MQWVDLCIKVDAIGCKQTSKIAEMQSTRTKQLIDSERPIIIS